MAEDIIKTRGATSEFKDDSGGGVLIPSAVIGIVKNNIDPTRSGKIQVSLKRLNSADPDNPAHWKSVRYLSPFFGSTGNTGSPDSHGEYVGNPNSYGFWATPPDINTEVLCVFVNGNPDYGYYIGSIPPVGLTHMVPAIGASDSIISNDGEAGSYGGAVRLPVSEINNANSKQDNNSVLTYQPRPVHSYQAAIYNKQGLLRDPDRGPISSSSLRESPSRVFGMSTPGRPIYQGGYDDTSIAAAVKDQNIPDKNFQIIGRRGGHSFVMDDGDMLGRDQLIRLRTATGHQILMNDAAQTLFIIHANGSSYIELGKEGTIDMYATNSVNIRTQGDLNLHADNNININAGKDLNINAENVKIESEKETTQFVGTNFSNYTKGTYTAKVDGAMSLASGGDASLASAGSTFVNGPSAVNLNTGSAALNPQAVKQVPKIKHTDTLYDEKKGYAASPGKLTSIVSRAPAHAPWAEAGKGVDVKVNMSAKANFPSAPSKNVSQVNSAAPSAPSNPTTSAVTSTVPKVEAASETLDKTTTGTLVSQMAVNASTGAASEAVAKTAGVVETDGEKVAALGALAMTPSQLVAAGYIKPGADVAINASLQSGKTLEESIPPNVWTGKDGVNSTGDFLKNVSSQTTAATSLMKQSESILKQTGMITGKESPTQTSGLILSTATAGLASTMNYVKSVSEITAEVTAKLPAGLTSGSLNKMLPAGMPSSLAGLAAGIPNPLSGSVSNLIAGGKLAGALADKTLGGLSALDPGASLAGATSGLFDKITSGFKPFKAGVPQNLTTIAEANAAEKAAEETGTSPTSGLASLASAASKGISDAGTSVSDAFSKAMSGGASGLLDQAKSGLNSVTSLAGSSGVKAIASAAGFSSTLASVNGITKLASSTVSSVNNVAANLSGMGNLPGGANAASNLVNGNIPTELPGTASLSSIADSVKTGVPGALSTIGSSVNDLKSKLGSGLGLQSFASIGLGSKDLAQLNSLINSVSSGGPNEVKLPTVAADTFDFSGLAAQSKELLGNPKIPALSLGGTPPAPGLDKSYVAKLDEARAANDAAAAKRQEYEDAKAKYGSADPRAEAILQEFKVAQKNAEDLSDKLAT